jgi:hypothetical protein
MRQQFEYIYLNGLNNCPDNDVDNDCIVDELLAITKTMRIRVALSGGKFEFYLVMVFLPCKRILKRILWIQKILRL